jgi:tyrosinase
VGDNPLFVEQRWGPANDGDVYVPTDQVDELALTDPAFIGVAIRSGGSTGFGGPKTDFNNRGGAHGGIESQPHDQVHGLVGGSNGVVDGLMATPVTAGLDPIFWLHHANIDRLWDVWTRMPTSTGNPPDDSWLKGPASLGERPFIMPMPGGQTWIYTPSDTVDIAKLGYAYDDTSPPALASRLSKRLQLLGADATTAQAIEDLTAMTTPQTVELMGANPGRVIVSGTGAETTIRLNPEVQRQTTATLALTNPTTLPDRVFLNLENVRGRSDATILNVYVNLPDGEEPGEHPELRAGSIALFGVREASMPDGEHAGDGVTFVLEITGIIDKLHVQNALEGGRLNVRLVPLNPVPAAAEISVGRISVYRQGQ